MEKFDRIKDAILTENAKKILSEGKGLPIMFTDECDIHDLNEFKDFIFKHEGYTSMIQFCHDAYDIHDIETLYDEIVNVLGNNIFTVSWLRFPEENEEAYLEFAPEEIVILDDFDEGYSLFAYTA